MQAERKPPSIAYKDINTGETRTAWLSLNEAAMDAQQYLRYLVATDAGDRVYVYQRKDGYFIAAPTQQCALENDGAHMVCRYEEGELALNEGYLRHHWRPIPRK